MAIFHGRLAWPLLLIILFTSSTCLGKGHAVANSVVQANLVFPRGAVSYNDTDKPTYRPVYPFPIILSIQNAARAWNSRFLIQWDLYEGVETGKVGDWIDYGVVAGRMDESDRDNTTNVPDDQWLAISASEQLLNTTYTELELRVRLMVIDGCDRELLEEEGTPRKDEKEGRILLESFYFNLSPEGVVPDMDAVEPCPKPVGAIWIKKLLDDGYNMCPLLGDSQDRPHKVQECPSRFDAADGIKVADGMLAVASCSTGSWPDPTALVNKCPRENVGAKITAAGTMGSMWLTGMLLAL